jgi:hypothetical protein
MLNRNVTIKWLPPAALLLIVCSVLIAPKVFAKIARNTIDTVATVADNGRLIIVTGPIENTQVEWDDLRVTITQRTTGAVAEGYALIKGKPHEQQWEVEAHMQGSDAFEAGPATAVALVTSTRHGQVADAHQWLVEIELVEEQDQHE